MTHDGYVEHSPVAYWAARPYGRRHGKDLAFPGLGTMGTPMARRLLAAGHPLTVWNRTAARAEPLRAEGAQLAGTPAEAVRDADVVVTMLADPAAAPAVAVTMVPALPPGAVWIDMPTAGADTTRELAGRLPAGTSFVDAPVMSGVDRAELLILAGGDIAPVADLLARLGTVTRTGETGSGAALKIVLISAVNGGVTVVAEALTLAEALGIPAAAARNALRNSPTAGPTEWAFARTTRYASWPRTSRWPPR